MNLDHLTDRLNALQRPAPAAIDAAYLYLVRLGERHPGIINPFIFSTEEGDIQLEWHQGPRSLILTLYPAAVHAWWDDDSQPGDGEEDPDVSDEKVDELLRWVSGEAG